MELIVASASPRRQELCERMGLSFTVIPAKNELVLDASLLPEEAVLLVAQSKAREVAKAHPEAVVLGADTAVVVATDTGEALLGKPQSREHAATMLRQIQGHTHRVITGVWVCSPAGEEGFAEQTEVVFDSMTEEDIASYVATEEPMDKAGAYGIQGVGMRYIREIRGDYYTVMGLPAAKTWRLLQKMDQKMQKTPENSKNF